MKFEDKLNQKGRTITPYYSKQGDNFRKNDKFEAIPNTLEAIEQQIIELNNALWENAWYIGKRLSYIKDNHIEHTKFNNIYTYASEKFNIGKTSCYQFIKIAERFSLVRTCELGSKLRLLFKLNDERLIKYLEWIDEKNPTYREIETKLKGDRKTKGRPVKRINLGSATITINLKKAGLSLRKGKEDEFLNRLEKLITDYTESI